MYNDCYGLSMDIQSIDQQNVCESCLDNDPSYVHLIYRNILDRLYQNFTWAIHCYKRTSPIILGSRQSKRHAERPGLAGRTMARSRLCMIERNIIDVMLVKQCHKPIETIHILMVTRVGPPIKIEKKKVMVYYCFAKIII